MSWFFGAWSRDASNLDVRPFDGVHGPALQTVTGPHLYLAAGGIQETCHAFLPQGTTEPGWIAVGCGIATRGGRSDVLDTIGWGERIAGGAVQQLDGHFAVVQWDDTSLSFACDQLGQRTVYLSQAGNTLYFGTRLDWVARAAGKQEIDLHAIGSRWLLFNQISYRSGITGIDKLGPGGTARFSWDGTAGIHHTPWLPSFGGGAIDDAVAAAEALVACACRQSATVSLGLSGGMDSRLMMALLMSQHAPNAQVHTFGDECDPDVRVAQQIGGSAGFRHVLLNEPLPAMDACIAEAREYVAQTQLSEPVSSIGRLRYYQQLHASGAMLIDGGFGEVARRQYLNRVAMMGGTALRNRDNVALAKLMHAPRAALFVPEAAQILQQGVLDDLAHALQSMPPVQEIGIGNFVDLLAVRTRVPNYGGPEQARLDTAILNFMPLVQPSFLRRVFASGVGERASGGFYRRTIAARAPQLTRFPLVKGGVTYPFGLPTLAVHFLTAAKARTGGRWHDDTPRRVLHIMEPFVRDIAGSASVTGCALYDGAAVRGAVDAFYRGEPGWEGTVNWWLTFELWRQSITR